MPPRQRPLPAAGKGVRAMPDLMEQITSLAKRRGIVFPSSEIYRGRPSAGADGRPQPRPPHVARPPQLQPDAPHAHGARRTRSAAGLPPGPARAGDVRGLREGAADVSPEGPVRDRTDGEGLPEGE